MKKILAGLLVAVVAVVALAGCGTSNNKTLIMATEASFRPYEYMTGNDVVGVDVEIANEIAKELGRTLEIDNMAFDTVIDAVKSGKADFGAAGMSVTEARLEHVDFSIQYAESSQVILTKKGSGIASEEDLNGKVIGVQMGTTADIVYNSDDFPDITVDALKHYTDLALELENGRIDAIVLDSTPAKALANLHETFEVASEELFTDTYAIAVQKGNTEVLEAINKVLTRMIADGTIAELTEKHLAAE